MPILQSGFQPYYWIFRNTHVSTIYASLIRRWIPKVKFQRERLETLDGDFLDLDWLMKITGGLYDGCSTNSHFNMNGNFTLLPE